MRIRRLKLANFRSVAEGEVVFPRNTVIIGGNSVGKSTFCEALDLLLGPDRLFRSSAMDEHDFFERRYLDEDEAPIGHVWAGSGDALQSCKEEQGEGSGNRRNLRECDTPRCTRAFTGTLRALWSRSSAER